MLAEVLVIEKLTISENQKLALIKRTFAEHEITTEQFNTTIEFHKNNPAYWIEILEKTADLIRNMEDKERFTPSVNPSAEDARPKEPQP